jgi:endonuclease YncB( thermonuclease family)
MLNKLVFSAALALAATGTVCPQVAKSTQTDKQRAKIVIPTSDVRSGIRLIEGKVILVYDGDTLSVQSNDGKIYSIRLQGIDAPDEKQNYFKKARNSLSDLVLGKDVKVLVYKKDLFDRYIGSVYSDGRDVGLAQVENGLAWHFKAVSYEQTAEDRKLYSAAEQKARTERSGLWEDKDPVAPWDFRGDAKLATADAAKPAALANDGTGRTYILGPRGGCYYLKETGEKVYVKNKTLCAKPPQQ